MAHREFDLVEIGDEFASSSSLMPQKMNPYPFEYVRARAAIVTGAMSTVFEILHNTNFQDIKEVEEDAVYPVVDAFDQTERSLRLLNGALGSLIFKANVMRTSANKDFATCTKLAAALHRRSGLSYRSTHRVVGETGLRALKRGLHANQVTAALVNAATEKVSGRILDIDDDFVRNALEAEPFLQAHESLGGPAPVEVRRILNRAGQELQRDRQTVAELLRDLEKARSRLNADVDRLTAE